MCGNFVDPCTMALMSIGRVRDNDGVLRDTSPTPRVRPWIDATDGKRRVFETNVNGLPAVREFFRLHVVPGYPKPDVHDRQLVAEMSHSQNLPFTALPRASEREPGGSPPKARSG